jgi:hypothetical protein
LERGPDLGGVGPAVVVVSGFVLHGTHPLAMHGWGVLDRATGLDLVVLLCSRQPLKGCEIWDARTAASKGGLHEHLYDHLNGEEQAVGVPGVDGALEGLFPDRVLEVGLGDRGRSK